MAVRDRSFDPVQVAHAGGVAAGLEGAAATGAGAVLLWGWMFAPPGHEVELACDLGGVIVPVELLDRPPRPDVVENFAASVQSRTAEVGFLGLAHTDAETLRNARGRITLSVRSGDQTGTTANRLLFEPGSTFDETVARRTPTRVMRPEALRRAALGLWPPESARILGQALQSMRVQRVGPARAPELSIVIPLSDDIGALRQTLSYLDMDGESARTEVVLSVARSELWSSVEQGVQDAATDLSLVLVTTGEALSVGGAARVGLQAAAAERVILVSDAIAPPSRGWISSVLEDLAASEFAAPDSLPRFDGLPHRFEPRSPGRDASIWSHESVTDSLAELGRRLGLDRRSPGLVAARRRALLDADIAWGEAINGPAFWAGLLNEALRRNASSLRSGGLFTYAPVSGPAVADDELLDTYALEQRLRGALSPVEPSAEPS